MKLKVKIFDIRNETPLVVVMHKTDAINYDIYVHDRVELKYKTKRAIAVVDILDHHQNPARCMILDHGEIGLFIETAEALGVDDGDVISLGLGKKPDSLKYIKKKVEGKILKKNEITSIVKDIVNGELTDIELTSFVTAVTIRGLNFEEIMHMTKATATTGEQFFSKEKIVIDKHCIGGVPGNRTTMIVTPILAAFGLTIPKTSSRAITSPAGTADTMECLANVSIPLDKMQKVVAKTNGCIVWGGAMRLAPADDKIIRIERPLSVDVVGLMLSSVMAKKYSVHATHVLIDIPFGKGAKVEKKSDAETLKEHFLTIGKLLGMKIVVILSDGRQPIGNGIGPLLEAVDVMRVLQRKKNAPKDLREKSIHLAGTILEFVGSVKKGLGEQVAKEILDSGDALKKMQEIMKEQGKNKLIPHSAYQKVIPAPQTGKVQDIKNKTITKISRLAGAPVTKTGGVYLHFKVGEKVQQGEPLFTVHCGSEEKLQQVMKFVKKEFPYTIKK